MSVEIVRELPGTPSGAKQVLVKKGDSHFVVSSVNVRGSGPETLVFPADKDGEILDWIEVAGGKRYSREEAIADLESIGRA